MDLNTPPPSYESATGAPGAHNQINPFLNAPPPSAPPPPQQYDEIISEPVTTTPILPQPYNFRPTQQYVQPDNQNSCRLTMPTPQTNKIHRQNNASNSNAVSCCFVVTFVIICVVVIIIGVSKAKPKPTLKFDFEQDSVEQRREQREKDNEWQEQWRKDNQAYIDSILKYSETRLNHNWDSNKNN